MNAPGPRCFAFGRFRLDPVHGELSSCGASIDLRPKALAVLHYLLEHPQRVVGKDELLAAVWGKVVVTDDSLVQCVREIRQALGDTDQRLIRTIPRSGYLFADEVTPEVPMPLGERGAATGAPTEAAPSRWPAVAKRLRGSRSFAAGAAAAVLALAVAGSIAFRSGAPQPGAATPPLSIVVMPLANIDGDPEHEYFAAGLTSDLATDLGRLPDGHVISYGSARAYRGRAVDARQVGQELGVRYVLEGSVQRLGDQVRVNLRLVDAASGAQRWAERFDASRAELPQLQAGILRHIGQTLEVRLLESEAERSVRERSINPDARDLLMHGWALWERRRPADNAQARELFRRALDVDPNFSLAWVGIANTHISDLHAGWTDERQSALDQAGQVLERAYAIGPRHRDVNFGRGTVLFFQGDIEAALAAFDREIEANAGNALAHVWRGLMLISLGRAAEAVPAVQRGMALSPRDIDLNVFYRSLAHAEFSLGHFDEAVAWSRKAVGHSPSYAKGYAFLAAAAALQGDRATAVGALEAFRRLQPKVGSNAAFRNSMMPGEVRMFDATPRFWEGLREAGLPPD
jgi:TolB-like protein/DNA-binding winged helix-turn-helix (wHTH) protein/Tfp pilus assembly protein PilF